MDTWAVRVLTLWTRRTSTGRGNSPKLYFIIYFISFPLDCDVGNDRHPACSWRHVDLNIKPDVHTLHKYLSLGLHCCINIKHLLKHLWVAFSFSFHIMSIYFLDGYTVYMTSRLTYVAFLLLSSCFPLYLYQNWLLLFALVGFNLGFLLVEVK